MKRRGFLAMIGLSSALPAAALAGQKRGGGLAWVTVCVNRECRETLSQWIDMTQPLRIGNQCQKCLWVMDTTDLQERIREYNGRGR